ncbi:rab GTPase-activating protein 1-like isoform X1 [Scophthalmus maximus]|uniref:Rab GTPase-activating protein 1-like n=1 Tax=Scophthalmus maximus TaxID=52904 RepID=A0A8D3B444_SCOMX|nr:rab GTPase-activating protein 1-like isoform X1 [Scophthalmus maximus]
MMEEVSTMMAYDAHVMEQMSEEEILACLVAETGPKFTVPTKKAKLRESRLQIMDPEEDALDEYLKENRRLQQTSLRLEQENDNLAHRLITSKVALRNALDKAEDKVDDLTKDLLQTRRRLQATEEEKAGKEEEAAMLKEMFRRELEKAEQQVRRSSGIIADYKQICSQLANRLERQQTAHTEELESLKRAVQACSRCQRTVDADEPPAAARASPEAAARTEGPGTADAGRREDSAGPTRAEQTREDQEKESLRAQTRELEQDLAQTKLQMVEAKCRIQELEHQKGILAGQMRAAKDNWISKAFTSLRTSGGGGTNGVGLPREDAPPAPGRSLRGGEKLLWPHRDSGERV